MFLPCNDVFPFYQDNSSQFICKPFSSITFLFLLLFLSFFHCYDYDYFYTNKCFIIVIILTIYIYQHKQTHVARFWSNCSVTSTGRYDFFLRKTLRNNPLFWHVPTTFMLESFYGSKRDTWRYLFKGENPPTNFFTDA